MRAIDSSARGASIACSPRLSFWPELEIAIAFGHESLVKALAWQTGNRFSPLDREL